MDAENYECFDLEQLAAALAQSLGVAESRVRAAIELLEAGNTLPFIARYRKEATGALDESALRTIEDQLHQARELAQRKTTILKTIDQLGLLTPPLREQIVQCDDKQQLENLYLPYKPKRRTRASAARERGLQPLADLLLAQQRLGKPRGAVLRPFVDPAREVPDEAAALQGACDIVAEQWAEDPPTREWLFEQARSFGKLSSRVKRGAGGDGAAAKKGGKSGKSASAAVDTAKFEMYFEHQEPVKRVPSHRFLAMQRGEAEGVLKVGVQMDDEFNLRKLKARLVGDSRFEFHRELLETVEDSYRRLLAPAAESAALQQMKERADLEAITVFGKNLRELLLSPPAGPEVTLGMDPGFRTGCKCAVVDATGKVLDHTTIYPTAPRNDTEGAAAALRQWIDKYRIQRIAIGNGTASRETDAFVAAVLKSLDQPPQKVMVSESGASIYSASELAAHEYPDLDVTIRGAVSIAHRLQDPLAELVKIDPKSIGVGQYQHDVSQPLLKQRLQREVESCVNLVGVDLNTASSALLSYVAGIGPKLAEQIVRRRDQEGEFGSRAELLKVPKLGRKAFEQAAGFLRIRGGSQPLDNSAVHPESYYVVERMGKALKVPARDLVGNASLVSKLEAAAFVDEKCGRPTIEDILSELAKPGRDPRSKFRAVKFRDDVHELADVKPGMILEGVVTNVTRFGAFVDVGVHQDGLVHISQLANHYIADPSDEVAVGDLVRVKVLEVDLEKKRIALSRKEAS